MSVLTQFIPRISTSCNIGENLLPGIRFILQTTITSGHRVYTRNKTWSQHHDWQHVILIPILWKNTKYYVIFIKILINHEIKTNSPDVLFMHTGSTVINFKFVQCVFLKDYLSHWRTKWPNITAKLLCRLKTRPVLLPLWHHQLCEG